MIKKIGAFFLSAAVLLCVSGCRKEQKDNSLSDVKQKSEIVIGIDDSFPPMTFKNSDNEYEGFDIDFSREVARRLFVRPVYKPIRWDEKEKVLASGEIDCIWSGLTIRDELKDQIEFSNPYLSNFLILVVRKDSGIKSADDLKDKVIGYQSGSSGEKLTETNEKLKLVAKDFIPYEQSLLALTDLEYQEIDAVIMDSVLAEYVIRESKFDFSILDEKFSEEVYGIAFNKGAVALKDEVQNIIDQLIEDGTFNQIKAKYFIE